MMQKFLAIAGASAMLLSAVSPALASFPSNFAMVDNEVYAGANSGYNLQQNGAFAEKAHVGEVEVEHAGNTLYTGGAIAGADSLVWANTTVGCDYCGDGEGGHGNAAFVTNHVSAVANTGENSQVNIASAYKAGAGEVELEHAYNTMGTGDASAYANAWTVVNTNYSGFDLVY